MGETPSKLQLPEEWKERRDIGQYNTLQFDEID